MVILFSTASQVLQEVEMQLEHKADVEEHDQQVELSSVRFSASSGLLFFLHLFSMEV